MQALNSSQLSVSSSQSPNDESGIHWQLTTGNRQLLSKRKGHPATWAAFSFKGE
jgi:hypothetical protein